MLTCCDIKRPVGNSKSSPQPFFALRRNMLYPRNKRLSARLLYPPNKRPRQTNACAMDSSPQKGRCLRIKRAGSIHINMHGPCKVFHIIQRFQHRVCIVCRYCPAGGRALPAHALFSGEYSSALSERNLYGQSVLAHI